MTSGDRLGCRLGVGLVQAAGLAILVGLGGCSTVSALNPVDWWHNLEGGPIAAARPPPPNADAPYPSLASVPDRAQVNDAASRGQIANALIADRANARYDNSLTPLAPATSGTTGQTARAPVPAAPRPPPPAPTGEDTSNATLAAASAPPKPAPRAAVQSAPLAAPVSPLPASSVPDAALPAAAPAALADMPQLPPAPAALPGAPQTTAPTPPPPTPPPVAPPAPVPVAGAPAPISFARGSAVLPTTAYAPLKALAQQRGGGTIAIVGFGAATDSTPAAQQAAMPLALARARAIATYLESSGVPATALRIDAEAAGQGGVARLIH